MEQTGKCSQHLRVREHTKARRGVSRAWMAWKQLSMPNSGGSSTRRISEQERQQLAMRMSRFRSAIESSAANNESVYRDQQVEASIRLMWQGAARAELHSKATKRWLDAVEAQLKGASSPISTIQLRLDMALHGGGDFCCRKELLREAEEMIEWQALATPGAQEIRYMGSKTKETLQAVADEQLRATDAVKQLRHVTETSQVAWLLNLQDASWGLEKNVAS